MQQNKTTPVDTSEETTSIALLTVQREGGITRAPLKKYLAYLGIEPICFHIGTRSLSISREAMTQVALLKQNPALLAHLPNCAQLCRDGRQATEKERGKRDA